jgi:O-antigen ligase
LARVAFFALLPAAAAGGGLALAVLLAAAGALSFRPSLLRQALENRPLPLLLLLAFVSWAALSSAWSPHPNHLQAPKLLLTVGLGLVFMAAAVSDSRLTRAAGLAAFLLLAALLSIEAFADMPFNRAAQPNEAAWVVERNPARGAVVLIAMTWAAAGGLLIWGGRLRIPLAIAGLATGGVLAAQFHQAANLVGFGAGLAAFGLALLAPRLTPLLVAGALAVWTLAAPFAAPLLWTDPRLLEGAPFGWAARIGVWEYVCGRIAEQPWIGHGLDASRAVSDIIVVRGVEMRGVPLHPHSASLQIWFETGLVGAALAAAALASGGWSLSRAFAANRPAAAAACGTIAALGFIANVSYGAWQEWWNAAIVMSAALVGAASVRTARPA